ncbi:uncharacterized protein LOC141612819 [Silene latifolia]|uniref:uncharacterized protein LOC141612819 n=1 Tax=Silene latifolia TaxID=37657 RepID=UPI003D77E2AA
MVWNIQGTGSRNKISALKEVVKNFKPSVIALLETHKDGDHAEKIGKILGYNGHCRVDAVGFSGGIWLYWRPDIVSVTLVKDHSQFITVEVTRSGDLPWFFTAVYASPNPYNRHDLWKELEQYAHQNNCPWLLAGDFNETRSLAERHGGDQNMVRRCELFNNGWRNRITSLKNDEGIWIEEKEAVKDLVVEYYKRLYTEDAPSFDEANIPIDNFQEFSNEQWDGLTRYFSLAEIEKVVFDMGSLKAPGPDGFQALFYQKNWSVIKRDVCAMAMRALEGKGFPAGMNDTHLVLIPKVVSPEHISQFRPISLCNVAYKIVSKALANRIKKVLPFLISKIAVVLFLRQITDNIVVFQEAIHTMRKKKGNKGYMAIKIDLEKAYDRLRWDFIEHTLTDMNLPILFINTIMECVSTTSMQILWNGETTEKFIPTRGVRQGDPLSSYLFVMCLEKLQQAIDERVRYTDWLPIPICKGGPKISNLFFADDMVLFAEARADQAMVIKYVLDNFCKASGEKFIYKGTSIAIGNGGFDCFWDHSWVEEGCLADKVIAPIPDTILGATVSEMWDANGDWKWDEFSNYLPQEELKKIAAYSISPEPDMEDSLYWNGTSHGKFSIQSALAIIKGAETPTENNPITWHLIWKLPVQQRIRMFIWLAAHGRLMTNYNRVRRGLADDPFCPRCYTEDETPDHLLRRCPKSEELWMQLGDYAAYESFYTESYPVWISKNASNTPSLSSPNWSMKFAITCWWIWKWRNNEVFGRADENPIDPIRFLNHQFDM